MKQAAREPYLPDYDRSLVNLINSILVFYGAQAKHPTLKELDVHLNQAYKNVVLMVFDGMGVHNLNQLLPHDSFLRRHMVSTISSVFPPTTTAATTSLESGLLPCEHSWLGWSLHFDEINANVNIFPNTGEDHLPAHETHMAKSLIPYVTIYDLINESKQVQTDSVSPFGSIEVHQFDAFLSAIRHRCADEGRHFLYTYWFEPDLTMHVKGIESKQTAEWVERIDKAVEMLSHDLDDTLLIITADHGLIDGKNLLITDYPEVMDTLKHLPTIEPRALAFHVLEGREQDFEKAFKESLGDYFKLYSKAEAIDAKLFGDGDEHPRFRNFLGDYLAIALNEHSLFKSPEEKAKFKGVHAGATEMEMIVPLIIVKCEAEIVHASE